MTKRNEGGVRVERPVRPRANNENGWLEAAVAWEVCASFHRDYAKGRDPFYTTRQNDFTKAAKAARKKAKAV